jgi:DnaJ-class molecular chaperone
VMRLMPAAPMPRAGAARTSEGVLFMPSMDCPNCDGTGRTQDASGEDIVCPMCDGTGVLVNDEGEVEVE